MKTNFRNSKTDSSNSDKNLEINTEKRDLTQEEYEDYVIKSGAKGSFMVYRSTKKNDELGLDEL